MVVDALSNVSDRPVESLNKIQSCVGATRLNPPAMTRDFVKRENASDLLRVRTETSLSANVPNIEMVALILESLDCEAQCGRDRLDFRLRLVLQPLQNGRLARIVQPEEKKAELTRPVLVLSDDSQQAHGTVEMPSEPLRAAVEMSNVRGPTSALTEFLRERGITARNTNRFRRRDADQEAELQASASSNSAADDAVASPQAQGRASSTSTSRTPTRRRLGRNSSSMNFDEEDETEEEPMAEPVAAMASASSSNAVVAGPSTSGRPQRTTSKRGAAQQPTAAEPKSKRSKSKKKGAGDDSDGDEDYQDGGIPASDWNLDFALPQATSSRANHSYATRTPGSIAYCSVCKSKFTITQYTKTGDKGPLCHKCGPLYQANGAGGSGAGKDKPKPVKKKAIRRKHVIDGSQQKVLSLQSCCIDIISQHIENVEALGHIGANNRDAISKSISKNRSLNPRTVQLFLSPEITTLSLYDCSKLDSESLQSVATFAPNLEHINLQLCGMLDNAVIDVWAQKLTKLRRIELYGPYLVRKEAWHRFFEAVGARLESFKIRESPRFDLSCAEMMVKHCPNVRELGLAQIGPLDKTMLQPLEAYGTQLTYLDVSDPGVSAPGVPPKSLGDPELIGLLKAVGENLTYLDLSKNVDLTDKVLEEAIEPHCQKLEQLRMIGCENIETVAMSRMFITWQQRGTAGLRRLHLDRMLKLDDQLMEPLLQHSGPELVELSLNSVDSITDRGLEVLSNARNLPMLESLDLSFVRAVDDEHLENICRNLPSLKKVFVFGCNRISDFLRSDRVRIVGKEKYAP
ncbi:RNI-like protein [Testicularia cyperi]|uniref:RNI-like protein n=1 Tax=Testicularia cyperi TaxID=1882483 RepID=A0A317XFN6_9BASI|nr:RNI-like protein [Testicularia cyperi]